MKQVVLGVSAGIAAYKACEILRELQKAGCEVHVILTERAQAFVGPVTFQYLSRHKVITAMADLESGGYIEHIRLARTADLMLVAPCTADILGKMANGIADDFLTTFFVATEAPVLLAPAMNVVMWNHAPVQDNVRRLREMGVQFVEPEEGELACGETGAGRLAAVPQVVERSLAILDQGVVGAELHGKTVLLTAGPTREPLDPVRALTSPSSGRMGAALAAESLRRGARVQVVLGPCPQAMPSGAEVVRVESALEMQQRVLERLPEADVFIAAAAVSDFRPAETSPQKLKKEEGEDSRTLELVRNPDILAEAGREPGRERRYHVGFAAESEDLEANARKKLEGKGLDLVVANPVSSFGGDRTRALLLFASGSREEFPEGSKADLAGRILDHVVEGLRS